jgi:hypothetical protein
MILPKKEILQNLTVVAVALTTATLITVGITYNIEQQNKIESTNISTHNNNINRQLKLIELSLKQYKESQDKDDAELALFAANDQFNHLNANLKLDGTDLSPTVKSKLQLIKIEIMNIMETNKGISI